MLDLKWHRILALAVFAVAISGCQRERSELQKQKSVPVVKQILIESRCPDDQKRDLEFCEFAAVQSALQGNDSAQSRFEKAANICGKYNQTIMNFCLKKFHGLADKELHSAFESANPLPSPAPYNHWKRLTALLCMRDGRSSEGGSGHSARISFCELKKFATQIDELSATDKQAHRK
jgi:uncharacterized protein YecT (DUF1311 family)